MSFYQRLSRRAKIAVWVFFWPIIAIVWLWKRDTPASKAGAVGLAGFLLLVGILSEPAQVPVPEDVVVAQDAAGAAEPKRTAKSSKPAPDETQESNRGPAAEEPQQIESAVAAEPVDPNVALAAAIRDELTRGNRDGVERVRDVVIGPDGRVVVTWAINDNFTEGMVKSGSRIDATKMLQLIREAGLGQDGAFLEGTFSMVDQYGVAEETVVIRASYSGETLQRINFDNFLHDNIWAIADSAQIHPAFQE